MTSVTKVAGRVFAGAVVSLAMVPLAQAATVAVNDEIPLTILAPGFSYVTMQAGQGSAIEVTTDGYLFCANVILAEQDARVVALTPKHSRWTLPQAFGTEIAYSDGQLRVNHPIVGRAIPSTLSCHARGANGEIATPFSAYGNGIFQNGYEGLEATQYGNLVNWQPVDGFDWSAPDWAQVPTDSCNFDMTPLNTPTAEEATLCAATSGVRPGVDAFGERAPTMWTTTTDGGTKFVYLARMDVRLGAQQADGANDRFSVPLAPADTEGVPSSLTLQVRDGYDSQYLSEAGTFCFLNALPAALTSTMCSGEPVSGSVEGVFSYPVSVSLLSAPALSKYVVVIRSTKGDLPPIQTPVAAISIMSEPSTVREERGDAFIGDNVIFGFPFNGNFPWMTQ